MSDRETGGHVRIIGVIDLLGGRAVHARGGRRHEYRPVDVAGHLPIAGDAARLARMYRDTLGLDELYVADLDAIANQHVQVNAIGEIAAAASRGVWLDTGVTTTSHARRALSCGATQVIVGLETLTSFEALREIAAAVGPASVAFSLDLREDHPVAANPAHRHWLPEEIAARAAAAGAGSIIILDLARVGSGRGVNLALIERVRRAAPDVTLVAGGGVRGPADLSGLASAGCAAVLRATALHGEGATALVQHAHGLRLGTSR
jgi:phosphoribosylformimino-5-aminoimidazole carboxamide ribotide isomerase